MLVAIIVIYWLTGTTDILDFEIKIPGSIKIYYGYFLSSFAVKMPTASIHGYQMHTLKHRRLVQ